MGCVIPDRFQTARTSYCQNPATGRRTPEEGADVSAYIITDVQVNDPAAYEN